MSLFTNLVVKLERQTLRDRETPVSPIEISRKYERQVTRLAAFFVAVWLLLNFYETVYHLVYAAVWTLFDRNATASFFVFNGLHPRFALVTAAICLIGFAVRYYGLLQAAIEDRIARAEIKAAEKAEEAARRAQEQAAEAERKAAEKTAQDAHRAVVLAEETMRRNRVADEATQRAQAVYQMRLALLRHMEGGIVDVLKEMRGRQEWVPEQVSEEATYELIRQRIRQAKVPEFGILHRSVDMTVVMVLGDRSCLPPEPSDELIASRNLPTFRNLLN